MASAKITFSNNDAVMVNEGDCITTIVQRNESPASMGKLVVIEAHVHNGLIPSIMDALCYCDFFYLNDNTDIVYGSKSIVKIELN